jgi:hypothetical protein
VSGGCLGLLRQNRRGEIGTALIGAAIDVSAAPQTKTPAPRRCQRLGRTYSFASAAERACLLRRRVYDTPSSRFRALVTTLA